MTCHRFFGRPAGLARAAVLTVLVAAMGGLVLPGSALASDRGLLIVGHGAPMPSWNGPVLALENQVKTLLEKGEGCDVFAEVRVALMEFAEPSIHTVMCELEEAGIDEVYVLPLFIAPSGHSLFDIPTILGLYAEASMIEELSEEGITIVDTDMKVTLGPTLRTGSVLEEIMLDRVTELSTDPEVESVVLLAHGDVATEPVWDGLCREIGSYVCSRTGVEHYDYALVEVGQSFPTKGIAAIARAAEKAERVLVVGLYLSMGVEGMAERSILDMGMMKLTAGEAFRGSDVRYAARGLLPDPRIPEWIVERAMEWVDGQSEEGTP
jgi:sirohydrochlorin ferrochelatase